MTLGEQVARAAARLVDAGVDDGEAAADAELLARHLLGWDRATYVVRRRDAVPDRFDRAYRPLVDRRADREPVSLITGRRDFWGLELAVAPGVLTPRPETELIVEASTDLLAGRRDRPLSIADLGTGSGCLAVALAVEFRRATVAAVDTAPAARALARHNATTHGVADRVEVVDASFDTWLAAAPASPRGFDLLVANLPYVPTADTGTLPPEVRFYEPALALDGGPDGVTPIRRLLEVAAPALAWDGFLIIEMGAGQAARVSRLVAAAPGLALAGVRDDLQGIPRTAVIVPAGHTT